MEPIERISKQECLELLQTKSKLGRVALHWVRISIDEISGRRIPES
ncbi:MAG TPA: hypothetical protein VHL54_06640 [Actinomycetota bacterium]|nr:hypothetical protein [Actinomycetota bacterium]